MKQMQGSKSSFEDLNQQVGSGMMITQLNDGDNYVNEQMMETDFSQLVINNDFIGKNKNMLAFYREHDTEKRQAFNKLREYFTIRAKLNREEF